MPEQRGQRWHDRRTAIVDAAAKLFAERGYHATGTAELCQAVGLGKGSLYYYVQSKENLLYLIHERVMGQVFDTATQIAGLDEPPPSGCASWARSRFPSSPATRTTCGCSCTSTGR